MVNSTRKAHLGLGPSSIAGTWSVTYNPGWSGQYENVEIDCFGRWTAQWEGTTMPMYFGAAQTSTICNKGDQGELGGIEYYIPAWDHASTKYECGWLDDASDVIYNYHYTGNNGAGGSTAHGHNNNGYFGRLEGTRQSSTACPAGLTMFLLASEWDATEVYGFNPDGVDRISGNVWNRGSMNPVITYPGSTAEVFDLSSTRLSTDASTSFTIGSRYTQCAWVDWVDSTGSKNWLSLFRPSPGDHTIIVHVSSMELGIYKSSGGFYSTGYVINTAEWNFLCIAVESGTSDFYMSVGGSALTHVGTINAAAAVGNTAYDIGHGSQEPGYVYMIAHWESKLSTQEMEWVMSQTVPPMVALSASPAPTASPTTAAPTASPTVVSPPAAVEAVGDPHMSDVQGRTFDLNTVGTIALLVVPKGAVLGQDSTLLHVQAGTKRVGACGSLYIQSLIIQGMWVRPQGGYNITATNKDWARPTHPRHKWRTSVGPGVRLTVAYGMTDSGILYLNFHAYGLANAQVLIGGLLGSEDDEAVAWAKEKPSECLSLRAAADGRDAGASEGSEASASL